MAASVWMKKPKSETPICDAGQRRNDAAGGRLADAERVADRQHQVADLQRVGIADRYRGERLRRLDLEHREVDRLVLEQQLGLEFAAVGRRHLHLVGIADDVEVGHHDARRVDQHARPQRRLDAGRHLLVAEEALEERIVRKRRAHPHLLRGVDVDDRRRRGLDQRREGELHLRSAERRAAVVGRCRRARGRPLLRRRRGRLRLAPQEVGQHNEHALLLGECRAAAAHSCRQRHDDEKNGQKAPAHGSDSLLGRSAILTTNVQNERLVRPDRERMRPSAQYV